ncbi:hypothetical protein VSR17_10275 [Cupriavidus taiwanensis]|uniref:GIY-YIG domain-containing protein n=1 Tax=Cupriavidus taiwanensis TaxID=164546 RepID=A0A375HE47_9BURK|nr:hypothetical protein [Cupriavidus taiwanensis]SOY70664.1 hypothetical protein CBM2592_B40366 [Cupriavidus taiwanensis]SOY72228.1 hypothetical protein CBM2588_B40183 [Cupriavidus taiwanensis]SOY95793.1 hypothetical protein CBM2591_B20364 [Cupriavidus taiwanensis]SOZ30136.1 hypothetical protein CBM2608_B30388 [Cupriavidus taiwanensis]SOZ75008.1 hypothetical protein CBM2617_B60282 [Cupriavidus taiwanensis]
MFKTAEGETLELAPWRMRRLLRLLAEVRRYPAGAPPQALLTDLRQLVARARRVGTPSRRGTARYESRLDSGGACCRACLLARRQAGRLSLVGLSLDRWRAPASRYESEPALAELAFESAPKSANVTLQWRRWPSLDAAARATRGGGVYLFQRGATPVYVGTAASLPARLGVHGWYHARQGSARAGASCPCAPPLTVWTANVASAGERAAVEHAIVRTLANKGFALANDKLRGTVTVGSGLSIRNLVPAGILGGGNDLSYGPGQRFELPR